MIGILIAVLVAALVWAVCVALGLPAIVGIVAAILVLLAGAYAYAVGRRWSGLRDLVLLRVSGRRPGDLLLAVPPAVAVLYAASDSTWYTGTPRYLLVTYPLFAVGLAALLPLGGPARRAWPASASHASTAVRTASATTPSRSRPIASASPTRRIASVSSPRWRWTSSIFDASWADMLLNSRPS